MHPDPDFPVGLEAPLVDASHPWLGLLPYREEHREFFFGRDREIEDILGRIRDNSLTLLYGQSGLGKSSLLAAGVLPRLREAGYAPVIVSRCFNEGPDRLVLLDQTKAAIRRVQMHPGTWEAPLDHSLPSETSKLLKSAPQSTLWQIFHHRSCPTSPVPVLIFDQFEEIFTLGAQPQFEQEVAVWLEQMTDLLQNRPPEQLASTFAQDRTLAEQYHFGDAPVRIVFTLREDYLAHLERWKVKLPLLMQNRMALSLLTGPQARQAVLCPAQLGEIGLVSREVSESIVRTVARVPCDVPLDQIKAVPPLLSLLCEQLNAARIDSRSQRISAEMVREQSDDILQRFYEDSFLGFPEEHRGSIRALLEDPPMITEGGFRNALVRDDAEAQLTRSGVPDAKAIFDTLIQRRLITTETRDKVQRLEITHDVLVPLLVRSRKERQDRDAKERAERKLAEEGAKTRRRRLLTVAMCLLSSVASAGAFFGWLKTKEAQTWARDAMESKSKALDEAAKAFESEKRALSEAAKATALEGKARTEAMKAIEAEQAAKRAELAARASEQQAKENLQVAKSETAKARELQESLERALLEFIPYRFAAALSDNAIERQSEIWADNVDYLDYGMHTRSQILASLKRDVKKWPTRQFLVLGKPKIETLPKGYQLEFLLSYTHLDSTRKPYTGELTITIRLNDSREVSSYKSVVERAKKG